MKILNCPICQKIKEEKEKFTENIYKHEKIYLCKNHLREVLSIDPNIEDKIIFGDGENCILCQKEKEITFSYEGKIVDLCFFHLYELKERIKDEDWKILAKRWEDYRIYIKKLIESYDYKGEKIKENYIDLIFDLFFGTGRIIR